MPYHWQQPDWPRFRYDLTGLGPALYRFARTSGQFDGAIAQLGTDLQQQTKIDLMLTEALMTSAIEGETLDREDVRSSLMRQFGMALDARSVDPKAEGIASLMVDVRRQIDSPLTEGLLHAWHKMIAADTGLSFRPVTAGEWRTDPSPMQIVSGPIGAERVHYEAPPPDRVPAEMHQFLDWYQQTRPQDAAEPIPGPVRSAIAHLWFTSIHPYGDGNGRVGRAIADHALGQDLGRAPLLSVSSAINAHRKDYYNALHQASGPSLDATPWVRWWTNTVNQAQDMARAQVEHITGKARFYDQYADQLNKRQAKAIRRIFDAGHDGFEGGMNAKKYQAITKTSSATTTRDLADLAEKGIFERLPGGGRSTRFALVIPKSPTDLGIRSTGFAAAQSLLAQAGVKDGALFDANPNVRYNGPIVAADVQHVIQQVAAKIYIAHHASRFRKMPELDAVVSIQQGQVSASQSRGDHNSER